MSNCWHFDSDMWFVSGLLRYCARGREVEKNGAGCEVAVAGFSTFEMFLISALPLA
jgi:hypothetical protein